MKNKHILEYFKKVKNANKELPKKEAFKDLLNRLYSTENELLELIDKITLGSEKAILEIPRKDKIHRGSADTLYNKIIIEFENNLKITETHAKEQLAGYLLGQFKAGEGYNFTLIATDCITWKVYSPDVSCLEKIAKLTEDELILNEIKSAMFVLTENNTDDFYYWIDRFLFKEEKQKATLTRIEEAFGYSSNVFLESYREMTNHFNDAKKYGEVQVAYEQWSKFLSIAYGSFDGSEGNFLIHTYLSVFAKMLAYAVVSNDDFIDDKEMRGIIDGTIFHSYSIRNFVDDDFFHWVKNDRDFTALKKVFRLIAQEISTFDFQDVDEDILKGVYQELIDLDTRHALGEYYTPDWLCERIVNEFNFEEGNRVLDPACGSGSFLIATVHRFRKLNPNISVEELNSSIYGIDIHPLSVQIAKTNILLALGKEVVNARTPIHLNVILANTLLAPDGVEDFFGNNFKMQIDKESLELSSQILDDVKIFDEALETAEDLAEQTYHQKVPVETFTNILNRRITSGINKQVIDSFYKIYLSLCKVKANRRDSIWKFIIQNLYKPYFLSKKFDFVIGNPPWFTYSSIKNEEYQNILDELATVYNVKPTKVANFPHLEIAAIFFAYCTNYFLKENGKICFVLPRSFFSADHHDNTRSGKAKGLKIFDIWDLNDVSPLFRIPSSVLFANKEKDNVKTSLPVAGIKGLSFSGKLPAHNCKLDVAKTTLSENEVKWFYSKLGNSSAFSNKRSKLEERENPYKKSFKQGATIVPRSFYFVKLEQETPDNFNDKIINLKTSEDIKQDAKEPWKSLDISGKIESQFLFRTALSKSILPFALFKPDLVVLPITIEKDNNDEKVIKLHSPDDLMSDGYINASKWFKTAERFWDIYRTEKNEKISCENYLNWQNKLTVQNLEAKYIVLYNMSGKDAYSTLVIREMQDFEFIIDYTTFRVELNNLNEAYYITSILNSSIPNLIMKDFQARGLFGARHVSKKILDVYFPKFDENIEEHLKLAEISKTAHENAALFIKANPPEHELSAVRLGRYRVDIKKYLQKEMKEIDKLVKKVIKN
ncbi:MAG: N-6 DNA methylase [Bacteroidetes bacterium]|nr:N-6 DNA methylase [Bacteroidota bacterium]MBU1114686.1 N-6 DNA methylase [Bacteroidota bacterium]MBU1798888.1 N-6 DNA methylase [Bacteroidota bacterium]